MKISKASILGLAKIFIFVVLTVALLVPLSVAKAEEIPVKPIYDVSYYWQGDSIVVSFSSLYDDQIKFTLIQQNGGRKYIKTVPANKGPNYTRIPLECTRKTRTLDINEVLFQTIFPCGEEDYQYNYGYGNQNGYYDWGNERCVDWDCMRWVAWMRCADEYHPYGRNKCPLKYKDEYKLPRPPGHYAK